ncbi:hypothetical protein [Methylomonas sp. TEB]|uniref:hypothetical protein n=1 Tax=Methylomonas sp. TEB TaxID=3398229 RepID=UPI0039F642AA
MIFIQRSQEPAVLQNKGKAEQQAFCEAYDAGKREFKFDSAIYGNPTVKTALLKMQCDKCCFCESKISHISYGDVEHYRPKGGYKQAEQDELHAPGYYWLPYTWENLLLSCTLCNQQFKKNLFPLLAPQERALNHHDDITLEQPLLINPSATDPRQYIGFRQEIPYAIDGNIYGKATIAVVGLDREALNEKRRSHLALINQLIAVIKLANKQLENTELQSVAAQAKQIIAEAILPTAEYSAMINAQLPALH